MSNETDAKGLRDIAANYTADDGGDWKELLERIANRLDSDAKRDEQDNSLQTIGDSTYSALVEMVEALECDYDRLEELRSDRDAFTTATDESDVGVAATVWRASNPDEAEELRELEEAAGECTDREDAETRIHEAPLSVEVRTGWYTLDGNSDRVPEEFVILLGTGGPATRIIGELDEHCEPSRARLQVQDWGTPWTDYRGGDSDALLTYCRCFYFGEG